MKLRRVHQFTLMKLRNVQVGVPNFATIDDYYRYHTERKHPDSFIGSFANNHFLSKGVRLTRVPEFDTLTFNKGSSGAARITVGQEAVLIGTGFLRDSELFKTIVHEEIHLRLEFRRRRGSVRAEEIMTRPETGIVLANGRRLLSEEDYVEAVAVRYHRSYTNRFGTFEH